MKNSKKEIVHVTMMLHFTFHINENIFFNTSFLPCDIYTNYNVINYINSQNISV